MKWIILGIFSFTLGLDAADLKKLEGRCFVWAKENCRESHLIADKKFIEAIQKKAPKSTASETITKRGWNALANKKDVVTALYRFNQALILNPENAEAWQGAGVSFLFVNKDDLAEKLIRKSIEINPKFIDGYLSLSDLFLKTNKKKDAKEWYEKALQLGAKKDPEREKLF
jgi:tetratricopeptide (TPR) repeat protein